MILLRKFMNSFINKLIIIKYWLNYALTPARPQHYYIGKTTTANKKKTTKKKYGNIHRKLDTALGLQRNRRGFAKNKLSCGCTWIVWASKIAPLNNMVCPRQQTHRDLPTARREAVFDPVHSTAQALAHAGRSFSSISPEALFDPFEMRWVCERAPIRIAPPGYYNHYNALRCTGASWSFFGSSSKMATRGHGHGHTLCVKWIVEKLSNAAKIVFDEHYYVVTIFNYN